MFCFYPYIVLAQVCWIDKEVCLANIACNSFFAHDKTSWGGDVQYKKVKLENVEQKNVKSKRVEFKNDESMNFKCKTVKLYKVKLKMFE